MKRPVKQTFRYVVNTSDVVRVAGAHSALGAVLAEQTGFGAVWASSFEISAARCLPDASLLTMTEFLAAAAQMQQACTVPVIADCDTGFGNNLNVTYMVHQYQAAGIAAVCMEDKQFPKVNSFLGPGQVLMDTGQFARKIETAKAAQDDTDFFVIARTEALIAGGTVGDALLRCKAYAESGADAVLIHSKSKTRDEVEAFLEAWDGRVPVVIVPTTYPQWHIDAAARCGASVVIYANHGLRATVSALRSTLQSIRDNGESTAVEDEIASLDDIFALQAVNSWLALER